MSLLTALPWSKHILQRAAQCFTKLPSCSFRSMADQPMMDQADTELLNSFAALGPLLLQASQYHGSNDDEPNPKKHRHAMVKQEDDHGPTQKALLGMVKLMAQVIIQHDKAIQMQHRQTCFVLFVQTNPGSALGVLTQQALAWKTQKSNDQANPLTLRTFLLRSVILELQTRLVKLSQSSQGNPIWDTAVQEGVILADGSWPFQHWCHKEKKLIRSHRKPMGMARTLKEVQLLTELLQEEGQVMRFHSLKPQTTVVPWMIELSLRETEMWNTLMGMTQSTLWTLVGASLKQHSQATSRPTQMLEQLLMGPKGKGQGKGKKKST